MAWESDAAKMTLVSNDQKPHFMTWDGVAVPTVEVDQHSEKHLHMGSGSYLPYAFSGFQRQRSVSQPYCFLSGLSTGRVDSRVVDFPWHILQIDGHVVGCPKVAADGTDVARDLLRHQLVVLDLGGPSV
ncbi:hypothetical protein PCH_Pc24g01750 [Penicillium rubens Wisconsin 54-1255]|uniref:Uncharacterized protein n=1 Tax=Penicillium rubens (strain ATCC 28089 / DSM 1075 / NRRL 1951 / Wisconsin 54-1255) TaxID=500485 RepID=B6HWW4_PENRW|nr:hypothetical protein PCH_Pc24g01750 [Penicillium rubens Wisconsin 54-1255]